MRRRVVGQETEYGHVAYRDGSSCHVEVSQIMGQGRYLSNGARMYGDVGNHMEYCTPECDSDNIDELVAHVLAGNQIISGLVSDFLTTSPGQNLQVAAYANNVCNYASADGERYYGTHENYQVTTDLFRSLTQPLVAYLATRHLVLGAGRLRLGPQSCFELSQRAGSTTPEYDHDTTTDRAIVNLRNEPLAKGTSRLHLTLGDNAILPQQIGLKFAIMHTLLCMAEETGLLSSVNLRDSVSAVKQVSLDPSLRLDLDESGPMTALDIQWFYFNQAHHFVEINDDMANMRPWIDLWGTHLERLSASLDAEDHFGQLCWATKKVLLDAYARKHPGISNSKLQAYELEMHRVTGRSTLTLLQERFGDSARYASAIDLAMTTPPQTTRARVRGMAVAKGLKVEWGSIMVGSNSKVYISDPLESNPTARITRALGL